MEKREKTSPDSTGSSLYRLTNFIYATVLVGRSILSGTAVCFLLFTAVCYLRQDSSSLRPQILQKPVERLLAWPPEPRWFLAAAALPPGLRCPPVRRAPTGR